MKDEKTVSPVIRSDGMTVEVGSINEETCSLHHVLCYHTQTVQNIAQFTEEEKKKVILTFAQEMNHISHVSEAAGLVWTVMMYHIFSYCDIVMVLQVIYFLRH